MRIQRSVVWAILLCATAFAAAPPAKRARAKSSPPKPQPSYEVSVVQDAATKPDLAIDATGSAALRAQILLDRAHFSVGEIDGKIGKNTQIALRGFRIKHQLPGANEIAVDQAVWNALAEDKEPALKEYQLTAADLKGPFVNVPTNMVAKAKLKHLGYASSLEGVGEKFHISPALLRRLNPSGTFRKVGEKLLVPNVPATVTSPAGKVVVSKSGGTVTAFDESGMVLAQYPSSTGSEHDPLPLGEWKVTGVFKNPTFHYNPDLFWDAKPDQSKETIAPGPRNPVGLVWIDLSKEHYGIHGTPSPSTIGYAESHGCIRLTNWDALELAGMVKAGTPVSLVD